MADICKDRSWNICLHTVINNKIYRFTDKNDIRFASRLGLIVRARVMNREYLDIRDTYPCKSSLRVEGKYPFPSLQKITTMFSMIFDAISGT